MTKGPSRLRDLSAEILALTAGLFLTFPGVALAEGSNPGGIFIIFILFPASILALLVFLVLACFKILHGSIYAVATFAFIPYAVAALGILRGPLSSESDVVQYFYLLSTIFALTTIAFGVMTFRYWKRYIYISRRPEA